MARPKKTATAVAVQDKEPKAKKSPKLQIQDYDSIIANKLNKIEFISSGCTPLDKVLGGGWALGRMSTIEGASSSGKTGLAIEAIANFHMKYPNSPIWYHDAEAAFDKGYAEALGLPIDAVTFTAMPDRMDILTLENYFAHMKNELSKLSDDVGGFAVCDSLDAMLCKLEMEQEQIDTGGFIGAKRAAVMSSGIKDIIVLFFIKNVHWMVLQQLRSNIGGMGQKASGGNAVKFYRSQAIRVSPNGEKSSIMRTIHGNTRQIGIKVKAVSKKSKVGLPYRECCFNVMFFFGIDNIACCLDWVDSQSSQVNYAELYGDLAKVEKTNKSTGEVTCTYTTGAVMDKLIACKTVEEMTAMQEEIRVATSKIWDLIDSQFLPTTSKYN